MIHVVNSFLSSFFILMQLLLHFNGNAFACLAALLLDYLIKLLFHKVPNVIYRMAGGVLNLSNFFSFQTTFPNHQQPSKNVVLGAEERPLGIDGRVAVPYPSSMSYLEIYIFVL